VSGRATQRSSYQDTASLLVCRQLIWPTYLIPRDSAAQASNLPIVFGDSPRRPRRAWVEALSKPFRPGGHCAPRRQPLERHAWRSPRHYRTREP
jgi:hypothetical protein